LKGDNSEKNHQQEGLAGFVGCIYDQLMLWKLKGENDKTYREQRDILWSAWFKSKMPTANPRVTIDGKGKVQIGDKSYEVAKILSASAPHAAVKDSTDDSWATEVIKLWIVEAMRRIEEDRDADGQRTFAKFLGISGAKPLGSISQTPSKLTLSCRNERDGAPKLYVAVLLQHLSFGSRVKDKGDVHRLLEKSAVQMSAVFHIPPIQMDFLIWVSRSKRSSSNSIYTCYQISA